MAAMPEDARQDYYTPQRLRWLLHLYPSHETVNQWRKVGLENMCAWLNGRMGR